VLGGGPMGILHVMLAKLQGARRIILSEIHTERLEKARQAGADRVVNLHTEDLNAVVMDETEGART
jgi:L-iditol 2-dehydrogenase